VPVRDLVPGQSVLAVKASYDLINYTTRTANLFNAGVEYSSRMRRVIQLPAANITFFGGGGDVFFVIANGPPFRVTYNDSLLLADERSLAQTAAVHTTHAVILGVSESVFALVALLVMLPAVVKLAAARQHADSALMPSHAPTPRDDAHMTRMSGSIAGLVDPIGVYT
jgi:hypothetical protein